MISPPFRHFQPAYHPTCPRIITLDDAIADPDLGETFGELVDHGGPSGAKAALVGFVAKEWLKVGKRQNRGGGLGRPSPSRYEEYLATLPCWKDRLEDHPLWWESDEVEDLLRDSYGYNEVTSMISGVRSIAGTYSPSPQDVQISDAAPGSLPSLCP